jgi:hypothetical protein
VAVVVVVAGGHADVEASAGEASLFGNVCENAVAVVAKEAVGVLGIVLFERGDAGAFLPGVSSPSRRNAIGLYSN